MFGYQGDGATWYDVHLGGGSCCGKPGEVAVHNFDASGTTQLVAYRNNVFNEYEEHELHVLRNATDPLHSYDVFVDDGYVLSFQTTGDLFDGFGGIETYAGCCGQGIEFKEYRYLFAGAPRLR